MSDENHNHKYVLKPVNCPYYCTRCGQFGFGLSYTCEESKECNFFHHKQCENPPSSVKYPFSTKCMLKFYNKSETKSLCDVCGKKVKGYHYKCTCKFIKRNVHPHCLSYDPTLKAFDGLTLNLSKVATTNCLHCGNKDLCSKVDGWAYVSPCGDYSYHVSCVMNIINDNWRKGAITGKCDPFECIKKSFNPADMDTKQQAAIEKKKKTLKKKKVKAALGGLFNAIIGNPKGLVGNAKSFFG